MDEGYEGERLFEHKGKGDFSRKWVTSNWSSPSSFSGCLIMDRMRKQKRTEIM